MEMARCTVRTTIVLAADLLAGVDQVVQACKARSRSELLNLGFIPLMRAARIDRGRALGLRQMRQRLKLSAPTACLGPTPCHG